MPEPAARWCHDGLGGPGRARVLHRRAAHRRGHLCHADRGRPAGHQLGRLAALPGRHDDWLGINYHSRTAVSGLDDGTFPNSPVNDLGWEIHPQGLNDVARWLHDRYSGPIWITENGTADNSDSFRSRYLYDHLRAIAGSGLPIERYYHWCFVDNWEWAEGEVPRFGIVRLDHATRERTVKDSGRFLAAVIADRGVTEASYAAHVASQRYRIESEPSPRG